MTLRPDAGSTVTVLDPREVHLTPRSGTVVRRTLPHRELRTIGAWCFVDHYGPEATSTNPMRVAPHPHAGLQTVTWLFDGLVEHRDSVGTVQAIAPGELNIMTAGHGISHSELSLDQHAPTMHGVQLWVALPDAHRHQAPHFEHHPDLPVVTLDGVRARVLIGSLGTVTAPSISYSPLMAAELTLLHDGPSHVDVTSDFEHGLLAVDSDIGVDGVSVPRGSLAHVPSGRDRLALRGSEGSRVLLLGGEPFGEQLVMWWNFIGRDHDEVVAMRESWERQDGRFGSFTGYPGERIPAPPLPAVRLAARGAVRRTGRAPDEAEAFS